MKKTILLTTILSLLFFGVVWSQTASSNVNAKPVASLTKSTRSYQTPKIKVYPNPATNYIMLSKIKNVQKIKILSLIGSALKSYQVVSLGAKYDVAELPNGLYLIQLLDDQNKIITTQRLNKR